MLSVGRCRAFAFAAAAAAPSSIRWCQAKSIANLPTWPVVISRQASNATPHLNRDKPQVDNQLKQQQQQQQQLDKEKQEHTSLDLPNQRSPTDPVKQILIKRIPLEFHGPLDCTKFTDETLWFPIYRFAYIGLFRSVVRFKIYLTIASLSLCIHRIYLLFLYNPNINLVHAASLSALTLGGLIFVGNYSRKIVCQIYRSEDSKFVRFSRLTFFANRLDLIVPIETVVPLTEINETARKLMVKFCFNRPDKVDLSYDTYEFYDDHFYIPLRLGTVLDLSQFEKIMGRILTSKVGGV